MFVAKARRQKQFDLLAEHLRSGVAEQILSLRIYDNDVAGLVDDDDCIGCGLEQIPELLLCWASVMSRTTLPKPCKRPPYRESAVMTTLAQKRVPSLRTRQTFVDDLPTFYRAD